MVKVSLPSTTSEFRPVPCACVIPPYLPPLQELENDAITTHRKTKQMFKSWDSATVI